MAASVKSTAFRNNTVKAFQKFKISYKHLYIHLLNFTAIEKLHEESFIWVTILRKLDFLKNIFKLKLGSSIVFNGTLLIMLLFNCLLLRHLRKSPRNQATINLWRCLIYEINTVLVMSWLNLHTLKKSASIVKFLPFTILINFFSPQQGGRGKKDGNYDERHKTGNKGQKFVEESQFVSSNIHRTSYFC